ncbi:MAG: hypothetical protein M9962_14170 [Oligoflexia bacterium]|nr:hypothetical protein [Oligoflexia bacterium]
MKTIIFNLAILSIIYSPQSEARFKDPSSEHTESSRQIERTPIKIFFAQPATTKEVNQEKATKAEALKAKTKEPQKNMIRSLMDHLIPRAANNPDLNKVEIPKIQIPNHSAGFEFKKPQESLDLKTKNRVQIHNFSKNARLMPVPQKEYTSEVRSKDIETKYISAFQLTEHKPIRTAYKINIRSIAKIENPPSITHYENMVKRIDSLFKGVESQYAQGIIGLWELSQNKTNGKNLQARDSLFAGLMSQRLSWEAPSSQFYLEAITKGITKEERYQQILWNAVEEIQQTALVDEIAHKIDVEEIKKSNPQGDKLNFAMAKRFLKATKNEKPYFAKYSAALQKKAPIDKLQLMSTLHELANAKDSKAANIQLIKLEELIKDDVQFETQQDAHLALARTLVKRADYEAAYKHYTNIEKNGKNRLIVMSEQAYVEHKLGMYADSLGKSVGLQSPYFKFGFAPDIHIVEILGRKATCDFGGAEAGVKRLRDRYVPELIAMESLLEKKEKPLEFYKTIIQAYKSDSPKKFERYLLNASYTMENQKLFNRSEKELESIETYGTKRSQQQERPENWEAFALDQRTKWEKRSETRKIALAEKARKDVEYLSKRLRHTFGQLELIALDIDTSAAKNFNLQSALNFPVKPLSQDLIQDDKLHWPFEDEIWEDELDYLKMKNPSRCARANV